MKIINSLAFIGVAFTVGLSVGCLVNPDTRQSEIERASCEAKSNMPCEVTILAVPVPE
jgi:hypothetical protein